MSNNNDIDDWIDSIYDDIEDRISDIISNVQRNAGRFQEIASEEFEACDRKTYEEFGEYQKEVIKKIFNESVQAFYASFKPGTQGYHRTYGLYELLNMQTNDRGLVVFNEPNYDELYDPSKMHPNRSGGNNLYDLVFVEGYHGGAKSIRQSAVRRWGAHPSPGTPYYRKHAKRRGKVVRYAVWSRPAEKTQSPYDMIIEELDSHVIGEMQQKLEEIDDRNFEEAAEKITARIMEIVWE